jgi:hypothetical protein
VKECKQIIISSTQHITKAVINYADILQEILSRQRCPAGLSNTNTALRNISNPTTSVFSFVATQKRHRFGVLALEALRM